ncbi:MAG: hypothetical protein ACE5IL_01150 [Myxococcota bacterium]
MTRVRAPLFAAVTALVLACGGARETLAAGALTGIPDDAGRRLELHPHAFPPRDPDWARLWPLHEIPGWDRAWRAGIDGSGVVVLFLNAGPTPVGRPRGHCGVRCDGARYRVWSNPGEARAPHDGIDSDHNGCTDDLHGCWFSADPAERRQIPCICAGGIPDQLDAWDRIAGRPFSPSVLGRFPGVQVFPIYRSRERRRELDPEDLRTYLQSLIDAHPELRFVLVHAAHLPTRDQPGTQAQCDAYRERPPPISPDSLALTFALEGLHRVVRVGMRALDSFWPYCERPTHWLSMGLSNRGGRPTQQLPFGMLRGDPYYRVGIADQTQPVPLKRLVAPSASTGQSQFSFQYVAPLTYVLPVLQVVERVPSEQQLRDLLERCASREGSLPGPDGLGGWDPETGYGIPDLGCVLERAVQRFGGSLGPDWGPSPTPRGQRQTSPAGS